MATTPGVPLTGLTDTADLRNGTVLVPDATADGEALAYDQAAWRLAGGTFTGDVALRSAFPALSLSTVGNNGAYLVYRDNAESEMVTCYYEASDGSYRIIGKAGRPGTGGDTTLLSIDGDDVVSMASASAVEIPAATAANQAAQVSAIDATTGRLAIGGIEMGDTGWRDVTADLVNGWTGTLYLRRVGNVVELQAQPINGSAKTNERFLSDITGFNMRGAIGHLPTAQGTPEPLVQVSGGWGINTTSTAVYSNYSWTTTDPWPSTLPGTAATLGTQLPA